LICTVPFCAFGSCAFWSASRNKNEGGETRARAHRDAASRFMWAMAGSLPDFEEATRALFAGDDAALARRMKKWRPTSESTWSACSRQRGW
jgi:hypothetical protein